MPPRAGEAMRPVLGGVGVGLVHETIYWHTTYRYPGGLKEIPARRLHEKDPTQVVTMYNTLLFERPV